MRNYFIIIPLLIVISSCSTYLDRGESIHADFMDFNYSDNFNEFVYKSKVNASADNDIYYPINFSINLPKRILNWKITNNEFCFEFDKKEIIYIKSEFKNEVQTQNWRLEEITNDEIRNKLISYWDNRGYNEDLLGTTKKDRFSKIYTDGKTYILLYNIEQKHYDQYLDLIKSFKYLKK